MPPPLSHQHPKAVLFLLLAKMFERGAYYGFQTLFILYMNKENLETGAVDSMSVYRWLIGAAIFAQIIGALLGDLLLGNKKAILIGGILQAIGILVVSLPSSIGLYIGLFLVTLGNGLYTSNLISSFGKLYLDRPRLLDAGFTIFYLVINLGSFLGVSLIGYLHDNVEPYVSFIALGMLLLGAIIPIPFFQEKPLDTNNIKEISIKKRGSKIALILIIAAVFSNIYDIAVVRFFDLQSIFFESFSLGFSYYLWSSITYVFFLPVSLIAAIFWSYFYSNQFLKLTIGFVFGALSFGLLSVIPMEKHVMGYLIALLFLSISEAYTAPVVHSNLVKYVAPKYLTIAISLSFIPTKLIALFFVLFGNEIYDDSIAGLQFGMITMTLISIGLIGYLAHCNRSLLRPE
ncbi:MAG: MFS transporter [Aureispira sp.]